MGDFHAQVKRWRHMRQKSNSFSEYTGGEEAPSVAQTHAEAASTRKRPDLKIAHDNNLARRVDVERDLGDIGLQLHSPRFEPWSPARDRSWPPRDNKPTTQAVQPSASLLKQQLLATGDAWAGPVGVSGLVCACPSDFWPSNSLVQT